MRLRPSKIRFSQDSINNVFDKRSRHAWREIGETLDDICEGRCSIESIPTITVVQEDGCWVTADNRRLWVFRELERLGKCETVPVNIGYSIPLEKRTSCNDGASIRVRGPPGGRWYTRPTVRRPSTSPGHRSTSLDCGHTSQANRVSGLIDRREGLDYRCPHTAIPATDRASTLSIERLSLHPSFKYKSKFSYGVRVRRVFIPETHPEKYKVAKDGVEWCTNCFSQLIKKGQTLTRGQILANKEYSRSPEIGPFLQLSLFKSKHSRPILVDERGSSIHDRFRMDLGALGLSSETRYKIKMVYVGEGNVKVILMLRNGEQEYVTKIEVDVAEDI